MASELRAKSQNGFASGLLVFFLLLNSSQQIKFILSQTKKSLYFVKALQTKSVKKRKKFSLTEIIL